MSWLHHGVGRLIVRDFVLLISGKDVLEVWIGRGVDVVDHDAGADQDIRDGVQVVDL